MAASLSDNPGVIAQQLVAADKAAEEEKSGIQNLKRYQITNGIPLDLQKADRWIVWKHELVKDKNGKEKLTKVPYDAKTGRHADVTKPSTQWSTFEIARDAFFSHKDGYSGIGFCFGFDEKTGLNYAGVDVDHLETSEDWKRARKVAKKFDSYSEISPSGKGIHIFVTGRKGERQKKCKETTKNIEIYDCKRFFTVTGNHWENSLVVNERQEQLRDFYNEVFCDMASLLTTTEKTTATVKVTKGQIKSKSTVPVNSTTDKSRPECVLSDDQVIQKASGAANGAKFKSLYFEGDIAAYNDDDSSADAALMAMLVFYTRDSGQLERLFSASALGQREKWTKRKDYRDRTIKSSLEFVKETYNPSCSSGHGGGHDGGHGGDSTGKPAIRMVTLDNEIGLIGMCSDFGTIVKVIEVGTKNDKEKYLLWISDCAVHIDTETRAKDETELIFKGIGAVDKREVKFTLRAGDLAEPRKFKAALLNAFGAKNQVGRLNFETVQKMSLNPRLVQRVEVPTWDEKGGPLMPGMDLVKNVEYRLSSMIPARVYDGDLSQAKECLRKLLRAHKSAPLLVAVVLGAPAIARWRKNDRFGLGLWGLTGTLKTTTALTAMGIYGIGYLDGPKLKAGKAGSTAIGAMELFAAAGFLPQIYDDMKTVDTRDAQNYVAVLHSVLEGQEKARGKKEGGLRESREFTCTPIITGEVRPQEASTSARVLNLNWTPADGKLLTEVQANAALLPVIGYHWLRFLAGTDHAFGEDFEAHRSAMVEKFSGLHFVNSGRLATIYILMKSVWDLLEKSPLGDIFTESRERFEVALDAAIEVQGRAVSEETEVARFLSALEELLASNPGIIQSLDGTKTIMGTVIGCWMPEGLFLLPTETLNELVKIKTFSQAPSIDSITQGLSDLGLLILGDDQRLKYRMRFNGARPRGWYIKYNVVPHNLVLSPLAPLSEATKNDNGEAIGPVSPLSPQEKGENISETNLKPIEPLENTKKKIDENTGDSGDSGDKVELDSIDIAIDSGFSSTVGGPTGVPTSKSSGDNNLSPADTNPPKPVVGPSICLSVSEPYIEVDSPDAWAAALQEIRAAGICGLDLETTGLSPLSCRARLCQLSLPSGRVYVADLWELERASCSPLDDLARLSVDPSVKKVGHNLKFDLGFIQVSQSRRLPFTNLFDTMLASQIAWAGYSDYGEWIKEGTELHRELREPVYTLQVLAEKHLGIALDKELQVSLWGAEILSPEQKAYAAKDAAVLLPLYSILQELLQKNELMHIADMEFEVLPVVLELELQGLPLDEPACKAMLEQKRMVVQKLLDSLQAEAKSKGFEHKQTKGKKRSTLLNPASRQDVLDYFKSQGYKIETTQEGDIKELAQTGCLFAENLLQYKKVSKLAAFLKKWIQKLSPKDGRLHPGYFQIEAATGRFSSRDPNAQQIPKRGDDGLAIRKLFRAPPGKLLVKADFSAIELRIMARLSGDKTMIAAFQANQDLHKLTASKISGVPVDQITKAQRQGAKPVNFLLAYGGQPELLQKRAKEIYGVDMSLAEAQRAWKVFFQTYPGVAAFHQKQRNLNYHPEPFFFHDHEKGFYSLPVICSRTVSGRKRIWGRLGNKSLATINQLYNSPAQGSGADLLKLVMAEVYSSFPEEAKMIASVHDEILLEVPAALAHEAASKLQEIMRRVGSDLLSPVLVDAEVEVLQSWGGNLDGGA